jgi:hypothetical protein
MRYGCLLAVLFASVCGWAQTSPTTSTKNDGNRLLENCGALVRHADSGFTDSTNTFGSSWCLGYLSGFAEGFDSMAMVSAKTFADYQTMRSTYICFPDGSTIGQYARVLVKFLKDHPERLHEDESVLVLAGLGQAFPCESKPSSKPNAK